MKRDELDKAISVPGNTSANSVHINVAYSCRGNTKGKLISRTVLVFTQTMASCSADRSMGNHTYAIACPEAQQHSGEADLTQAATYELED